MVRRQASSLSRSARRRRRAGGVTVWLLVAIVVFLGAAAIVVDVANIWSARVELQSATDAAALAAVQDLVNDDLLLIENDSHAPVVTAVRNRAIQFGRANLVLGSPLELQANENNLSDGDIVLGWLDGPRSHNFVLPDLQNKRTPFPLAVNAVRVTGRRTKARDNAVGFFLGRMFHMSVADVETNSTAMLDRDVVGFRPQGNKPIPMVPIAILSDPTAQEPTSWEAQLQAGIDQFRFDRTQRQFLADKDGDGIPEVRVSLAFQPAEGDSEDAEETGGNACLLQLGIAGPNDLGGQVLNGIASGHLKERAGKLRLGPDGKLAVPQPSWDFDPTAFAQLEAALAGLQERAEPVVWPVFTGVDAGGNVQLTGFVAARVVGLEETSGTGISFILQPAMMSTTTAVTDSAARGVPGLAVPNPYISKVRMVE